MRNLATALLVLFIILLTSQFIRHAYVRIFSSQESVLDKYNNKKTETTIDKSLSLRELSMIYADAEKRIKLFESGKSKKTLSRYDNTDDPYIKKTKIQELITSRESDYKMIKEIIVFWIAGLLLIAGGSLIYIKYEIWIGASLVTSGFLGMIWKTSPMFFLLADKVESSIVLNIKLIFTAITLAVLIAYWFFSRKYLDR